MYTTYTDTTLPIMVNADFDCISDRLLYQAVILPDIIAVIDKYRDLLGLDNIK